jgi:DNA-binding GntR family transcriptional regulator
MDTPSAMKRVTRTSLRHMVGDQLREAIASGELAPGERLNEVAVAKRLGVSPTPVREAFRDLEQSGLIVVEPHRGVTVRPLTHRDLSEIYSLRAHLEQMAIKLAHPRLDEHDFAALADLIRGMEERAKQDDPAGVVELDVAFHRYVVHKAGHDLLLKTWEQIHPSRWTYVTVRVLSERGPLYIARRHWPLLKALQATSPQVAVDAAVEHIEDIGDEALKVLDAESPILQADSESETAR